MTLCIKMFISVRKSSNCLLFEGNLISHDFRCDTIDRLLFRLASCGLFGSGHHVTGEIGGPAHGKSRQDLRGLRWCHLLLFFFPRLRGRRLRKRRPWFTNLNQFFNHLRKLVKRKLRVSRKCKTRGNRRLRMEKWNQKFANRRNFYIFIGRWRR
jgi:hypothetical protein